MRITIQNDTGATIQTPSPIEGSVADGETGEWTDVSENGFDLVRAIRFLNVISRTPGVTVRVFRGDPEEECEVVRRGPVPNLRRKVTE